MNVISFYSDVAIGAPYEDDGEGVVYIYRGSNKGLVETPMQVYKCAWCKHTMVQKKFSPQVWSTCITCIVKLHGFS